MNQFAKLALLLVVAFSSAASAITYQEKSENNNWGNGSKEYVWKNGTDELCWRNNAWSPATANANCDGAIVAQVAPPARTVEPPPAPAPEPAPVAPTVTTEKVTFSADALFDFDRAVLKSEGKTKLNDLASKLKDITLEVIVATGYTDSIGNAAYNKKLSLRRAQAVKNYLVNMGIDEKNIYVEGKGEANPVASNKTSAGRAKNRRVEIEVVGKRDVAK